MGNILAKIEGKLSISRIYSITLLIIFSISLTIRISLPYDNIFIADSVRFAAADSWLHMRLVENLVHHFPVWITFDPYALFPDGQFVSVAPFFDLLLGSVIWVIGLGSPTQHTIEIVGAYFPALLGALVTVPVYFIGRELFNRNVGLLSAALIAILPGEFLHVSILGYTDHHVAEVLFSTTAALLFILAIKRAKVKETSFSHIRRKEWGNVKQPLVYALLTGLVLGLYLLSWTGGILFVFLIVAYIIIQYIIDHLRSKSTDYLCIIGVPMFLIPLIMAIPLSNLPSVEGVVYLALATAILIPPALSVVSHLMANRNVKRIYYPLVLAGLGFTGMSILYVVAPSSLNSILGNFNLFAPSEVQKTIAEMNSILSRDGPQRLAQFFTTNIVLALVSLSMLIYAQVKGWSSEKIFLIVWSLIMLVAMLGQNRFAYYFAVNVALLTAYLCWMILSGMWSEFRETSPEREKGKRKITLVREILRSVRSQFNTRYVPVVITIIIFLIAYVPNIVMASSMAERTGGPNEAWYSSLIWMRENTPDPFEDLDFYYELYESPPAGESYDYPESAYGVLSWWHRGYWITRIAHRIPNANPGQVGYPGGTAAGADQAAQFFLSQDEPSANDVLDELGSKYVIIDYNLSREEFPSLAIWDEVSPSQFAEAYYQKTPGGNLKSILLYYPDYYRSMCSRLYNFSGEMVVPDNSTLVISYDDIVISGEHYKQITSMQSFATYEEAQEYLENQNNPKCRIVGENLFTSPVPLESLEHYKLVHESEMQVAQSGGEQISYVKIFEYLP